MAFLTGATGLVGSYLLKVLLANSYKVYVLVRKKGSSKARERVEDVLKFWDKDILSRRHKNLIIVEGDITKKNLGLNKQNIDLLKNEIEEIFHCAAVTQFNWPLEEIREVNVGGTKNVLELAIECKEKGKLKKVNHLSTAYVCGDHKGVFKEDDLDVGQKFNSTYEQSKFEAEKLVEVYRKKGLWVDIFRPPLIVGESVTGKTITFQQSVYQLLHMLNLELFDCFPGRKLFLNIVFLDELCKVIFKISSKTSSINKNYHLFNSGAIPFEVILDISTKFLNFRKPKLVSRHNFLKSNPTPAQKILLENNILLFNNNVRLESKMTNKVFKKYGFELSNLNRDFFLKLLKYCVKEGFLKKKL